MAQVLIRNIDEQVMERLRARAAERRQSLEQTLREVLAEAAKPSRQELLDELEACRALTPDACRTLAQDVIREIRDEESPWSLTLRSRLSGSSERRTRRSQ